MKIITRQTQANEAAERWKIQYHSQIADGRLKNDRKDVYNKLVALGSTPNPDDVDEAIGNKSWTECMECTECYSISDIIIQVGQEQDYDSMTAYLCPKCLRKAIKLLKENKIK